MTNRYSYVLSVGAVLLFATVAQAQSLVAGGRCTLSEATSMRAKFAGRGKKTRLRAGTKVKVRSFKKGWAKISANKSTGFIRRGKLEGVCQASSAFDSDVGTSEDSGASAGEGDTSFADELSEPGVFDKDDEDDDEDESSPEGAGFLHVGGGLFFGSEQTRPGFRGGAYVPLYQYLKGLRAGGTLTLFTPKAGQWLLSIDAIGHYIFFDRRKFLVYGLTGPHIASSFGNVTVTKIGWNIGVGGEYELGFANAFAEIKYSIVSQIDQAVFGGGLRFTIF